MLFLSFFFCIKHYKVVNNQFSYKVQLDLIGSVIMQSKHTQI